MKQVLPLLLLFCCSSTFAWGPTGHRVVGEIAERHLTDKARKALQEIMGTESLAVASTWMDEVRSDDKYYYQSPWHYVSIPDGKTYEESDINSKGDVIAKIETYMKKLKEGKGSKEDKLEAIRILTHLIGDIHQPLHVGRKKDRGGNDIEVTWFGESSNLHRVWDSEMIDGYQMSYTELCNSIDHATPQEIKTWQESNARDWAKESMAAREVIYDTLGDCKNEEHDSNHRNNDDCVYHYRYRYSYVHLPTVKQRLLQAGIRLAGVLNALLG